MLLAGLAHRHDVAMPAGARVREVDRLVATGSWLPVRTISPSHDANFYGGARYPYAFSRSPVEDLTILEAVH
jgi:hypothetical protein